MSTPEALMPLHYLGSHHLTFEGTLPLVELTLDFGSGDGDAPEGPEVPVTAQWRDAIGGGVSAALEDLDRVRCGRPTHAPLVKELAVNDEDAEACDLGAAAYLATLNAALGDAFAEATEVRCDASGWRVRSVFRVGQHRCFYRHADGGVIAALEGEACDVVRAGTALYINRLPRRGQIIIYETAAPPRRLGVGDFVSIGSVEAQIKGIVMFRIVPRPRVHPIGLVIVADAPLGDITLPAPVWAVEAVAG